MEFKTKKEWEATADKLFAEGKSPQEINKIVGEYNGPEGRFTIQQAQKSKRGFTVVDKNKRKNRNAKRNNAIKEQDDKLVETLKKGGVDDVEAQAILKKEKAGYADIEHQAKKLNKEFGPGAFNAGHETAALEGGGNYGRNARVEIGKSRIRADGTRMRGNQSRGKLDEAPDSIKPVMGIPRSGRGGEDTALFNLLEKDFPGIMDLGLTPKDKQDIKRNPAAADDIIAARQARLSNTNGSLHFKPNQALRVARMAAPLVASIPISAATSAMSASAAVKEPTANNIEDAVWDGANLAADLVGAIPLPMTVAAGEAAQKGLGIAHQARIAQRAVSQSEYKPGIDPINGALHFIKKLTTKPANMEFTSM